MGGEKLRLRSKFILAALIAFAILQVSVATAFAQDTDAPSVTEQLDGLFDDVSAVVPSAFVIAFATSMLGYFRNTPPEDFELVKFVSTLVLSIVIGVATMATGWDYNTVLAYLANAGLTIWIYWGIKIIALKLGWVGKPEQKET